MSEELSWGSLPGIPRIMNEFVAGRSEIVSLLGGDWRHEAERQSAQERRQKKPHLAQLATAIEAGYGDLLLPAKVKENIDALRDNQTLAIVTGQQVGIFGGPLYTIYKALSAIVLAKKLKDESAGKVVPIFWMETGDADFEEINHISFPDTPDRAFRAVYSPQDVITKGSISAHQLKPEIAEVVSQVASWMEENRFGETFSKLIVEAYKPDRPIADAFRRLLTALLGEDGLVVVDPQHSSLVSLADEFWTTILDRPERLNRAFAVSSSEVTNLRLPLQVKLREKTLPIMQIDSDGNRQRIHVNGNCYSIGKNGGKVTIDELRATTKSSPGALTPSALLRPLLQDWLLPTWIYVGGPSEIAYHAQIGRGYDLLNIPRPLIAPRISVTLIERKDRRLLDKHNWATIDAIGGRELLLRSKGGAESLENLFVSGSDQLNGWLGRIAQLAEDRDVNIAHEVDQAGRKLNYQWNRLSQLTLNKIIEHDRVRTSHAERLLESVLPDGILQERHTNVLYYLSRYGRELFDMIYTEMNPFKAQHLAIDLEAI